MSQIRLLHEQKVLRDPVHEYVRIEYEVIWKLLDTPQFQRLRRIHQLGAAYMVYHGAEHSRFSHSVGVYEIARRMIEEIRGLKKHLSEYDQVVVLCAALLHDIGHGPFSHAFENVTGVSHELMTLRIIKEDPTITKILNEVSPSLASDICAVINHSHSNKLLVQMISSQIDADRMDYLLRDAYFTGVSYGAYDLERILRTFRIKDDQLVIKQSGMNAVEDYIMARYQMYWQVYFHPVSRAYEHMLWKMFERIKNVYQIKPEIITQNAFYLIPFVSDHQISLEDYHFLDDHSMIHAFKRLSLQVDDPILRDLATRLLNRNIFKYTSIKEIDSIRQNVTKAGYDINYYLATDTLIQKPYLPYETHGQQINILMEDFTTQELSAVSPIVKAITSAQAHEDSKVFFPNLEVTR